MLCRSSAGCHGLAYPRGHACAISSCMPTSTWAWHPAIKTCTTNTRRLLRGRQCVDHPRHAEAIGENAEVGGEESPCQRHLHLSAIGKSRKEALRFGGRLGG